MHLRWEDFDLRAGRITNCSTKRQSPAPPKRSPGFQLPLLGSNQDSSDPESDVLPVTPRGKDFVIHPRVARSS